MNCPSCGNDNPQDNRFCGGCGTALEKTCADCGYVNPPDHQFCGGCGHPLQPTPKTPRREPNDYTPKHLAEKILTSRSALEGERKDVTVLFADIKGSMDLAGRFDPEEWHQILDRFFAIMTEGVHRFEGTVNQYTGDGIMALFGAPIAHEDHAQRACHATLQARDELSAYADRLRVKYGIDFGVRMGLNSGEVVVGRIGDDLRMDYTAQGHTVGLAQRIEQFAAPGRIYLSEYTQRLVEGYFKLRELGASKVKGMDESVGIFELEGASASRTRLDVSRSRGLSRFVGRADEMQSLDAALARAKQGHGQVVGVVGEPGLGKSRLCFEFVERCRAEGITVYEAHCPAHGKNIPFIPILELFRDFFGIGPEDVPARARQKIAGSLLLLDPELHDTLPALFEFMGVADPSQAAPQLDPDARRRQLFGLMSRLYRPQGAEGSASVVLVDDLHWVDPGSDSFVAQLVEITEGSNCMLLLNFRPEYEANFAQKAHYQQLPLVPLEVEVTHELVDSLLGTDPTVQTVAGRIVGWTSGNPFFTEEVIQTLIELGHLKGEPGAYRLTTAVEQLEIPANVRSVLAARIDRLPESAKYLLHMAGVIGKKFSSAILEAVAGLSDGEMAASIERLKAGDFIHERAFYPVVEYAFKHPLTHEVAYNSQLGTRQRQVHAAVAAAIETIEHQKLDENAALLAHHWEQAGEALDAARWHRRAAEWVGMTDVGESMRHWESVRALLKDISGSEETDTLGIAACRGLLNLGWRLGQSGEFDLIFEEGRALSERSGDRRSLAILHNLYGNVLGTGGDLTTYRKHAEEASRIAEEIGDPGTRRALDADLATCTWWLGDFKRALPLVECYLAEQIDPRGGEDVLGVSPMMHLHWVRAELLAEMGQLDEARNSINRAAMASQEFEFPELVHWTAIWRIPIAFRSGDAGAELPQTLSTFDQAVAIGMPVMTTWAHIFLGMAYLANGDWEAAAELEKNALNVSRDGQVAFGYAAWAHAWLAEALLGAGDVPTARGEADKAIAMARQCGSWLFQMDAQLASARILIRGEGNPEGADIALNETSALVEQSGGRCRLGPIEELRSEMAAASGDSTGAESHLREAHRLFGEMGAKGHAKRIEKDLKTPGLKL